MIRLAVDELKPAMILAKPVYNHQELLLLDAGVKLSEKNIRIFKSWGVAAVWVKGDDADTENENAGVETKTAKFIELELKRKFADVLDDPVMLEIMKAAGSVLSKSLNKKDEKI